MRPQSDQSLEVEPQTLTVRCRLFGRYAELLGAEELEVTLPVPATAGAAVAHLRETVAAAGLLPALPLVAINRQHARLAAPLADGDEVALLPPLAGG